MFETVIRIIFLNNKFEIKRQVKKFHSDDTIQC